MANSSLDRADSGLSGANETQITPMYHLNSQVLPLQINFNPLMITFCLFLRALADFSNSGGLTVSAKQAHSEHMDSSKVAEYCHIQQKKIISKLY